MDNGTPNAAPPVTNTSGVVPNAGSVPPSLFPGAHPNQQGAARLAAANYTAAAAAGYITPGAVAPPDPNRHPTMPYHPTQAAMWNYSAAAAVGNDPSRTVSYSSSLLTSPCSAATPHKPGAMVSMGHGYSQLSHPQPPTAAELISAGHHHHQQAMSLGPMPSFQTFPNRNLQFYPPPPPPPPGSTDIYHQSPAPPHMPHPHHGPHMGAALPHNGPLFPDIPGLTNARLPHEDMSCMDSSESATGGEGRV